MKRFTSAILLVLTAAALLLSACTGSSVDSDTSVGAGSGITSDEQGVAESAALGESGDFSVDDKLSSAEQSEGSAESAFSSADSADSAEEASEDTSDVVAVVTPSKPDDISDESKAETPTASAEPPVEVTADPAESKAPTEDNTSEAEHVHSYNARQIYATCTTDGYIEHTCSCGDSYKTDIQSAFGHKLYKKSSVAATLEAEGTELWECQYCRSYSETKATPKLVLATTSDEEIELTCTYFIELLNEERAKLGAPALSTAPIAHEMAMVRAKQLTTLFAHRMPDGRDSRFIYKDYQYNPEYEGIGADGKSNCLPFSSSEDIAANCVSASINLEQGAYNTARMFVGQFANSAGHWADLTNPEYTGVGVGIAVVKIDKYDNWYNDDWVKIGLLENYHIFISVLTMDKTYG